MPTEPNEFTPTELRMMNAHRIIKLQDEPEDIQFIHSCFAQIGLPRSRQKTNRYEHTVQNYSLSLEAGRLWTGNEWREVGLPFGVAPRLMLIYITTFAKRHKTKNVHLGQTMAEFLSAIGIARTGGKRGGITNFKRQAQSLAACRIEIGFSDSLGRATTIQGQFVEKSSWDKFDLWISNDSNQMSIWNSEIELSGSFYESILDHSVPLDYNAVSALHDNALALDLYAFLVHRLPRINKPVFLNWEMIRNQFCPNYSDSSSGGFRSKFNKAITRALLVYPGANVERTRYGYNLKSSPKVINAQSRLIC